MPGAERCTKYVKQRWIGETSLSSYERRRRQQQTEEKDAEDEIIPDNDNEDWLDLYWSVGNC